jgi:pimeloyl-ACP methyl ester carboxylesterase
MAKPARNVSESTLTYEATSRFVEVADGVRLHYHEAGDGPPIVLMHGGGAGSMAWTQFSKNIDVLSLDFRVLMFDHPQYGKSDKPSFLNETVYAGCARLIGDALDRLELTGVDLVGVSQGAGVAAVMAAGDPDRVRRLVLASPGGIFDSILTPVPMDVLRETFEYYNPGPQTREKLVRILERMVYDRTALTDEIIERRWNASIQPDTVECMQNFGTSALGDVRDILPQISQPALILWGLEDRVLPLDAPLVYAKLLPNAELVMLQKVGHWIPYERASDFNRIVREFLVRENNSNG